MDRKPKYTQSSETKIQRQGAARKHSIHAFEGRGEKALDPSRIERLTELRQQLAVEPGREEYRLELTARMAMICELGFAHLRQQAEAGDDIWEGGIIRRLATYVGETRRLLESIDGGPPQDTAAAIIARAIKSESRNT